MSTRRRNAGGPDRNARWPNVTEIQTILFDGARWHPTDAQVWALDHGFKAHKIDQPAEYIRIRQHPPADYMRDRFRTISLSDAKGIKAVIGVPLKKTGRQRRKAAEAKAHNRNPHPENRMARRRRNTAKTHTVNALLVAETPLRDWTRGPGRPARALRTLPLTGGYEARLKYSYGAGWRGFYAKGVKATVWGPRQPTQGKAAKALARAILEKT